MSQTKTALETYEITFEPSGKTITVKETQTILDAACNQGVNIEYACKGGGCGLCKIKVADGDFERGKSSKAVLPDSDRKQDYTLACKTYPKSNMKVHI